MRILQVNKYHYPRGGADKYFLDISEALKRAGHEVAVFSMSHPQNTPSAYEKYFVSRISFNENLGWKNVIKIPGRVIYSLEAKRKFKKLVQDFKPDIIHLHNIYHQISPSILSLAKKFKIPVVMHLHDYKLICPNHTLFNQGKYCDRCLPHKYFNCFKYRCLKDSYLASLLVSLEMYVHHSILKIYEKGVGLFIAPSLFMKEICQSAFWPEEKIVLAYNPYSEDLIKGGTMNEARDNKQEDYLLYFGRLSPEKGLDVLIKAAFITNSNLKIVGSGEEEGRLRELVKQEETEGHKAQIDFLGFKSGNELRDIILRAKAVVMPSIWAENMPLSLLEAMKLGKVVIASRIGGFPEMISDGVNGFLFNPNDVNDLVLSIKKLASFDLASLSIKAQERVKDLSPDNNLAEVLKIYQQAIKLKS
ncbi:MAG: glycosyltransferase [Bacteroidales bacterium]|nr:glycosyltransferase [Bacteroidales bacterium]